MKNSEYKQTEHYKQYIKEYNKRWYEEHKQQKIDQSKRSYEKLIEFINTYKSSHGCQKCGFNVHYTALVFHHLNVDSEKIDDISSLKRLRSKKIILEEMKKCIVLCANCHALLHANIITLE